MSVCLFIINPQNDFIDEPGAAMPVKGSSVDLLNLTDMLYQYGDQIDRIVVSLDQHHYNHIAHSEMWIDGRSRHPKPYTRISHKDVEAGKWQASIVTLRELQAEYVRDVEAAGSVLTIWTRHCIIGSKGASIYPRLSSDLSNWANPERHVHFYNCSGNWSTEHISAFRTVVPRHNDGTTWFNNYLYGAIQADTILIAGETLSHQIQASVNDAIDYAADSNIASRMIILIDCTSPMTGTGVNVKAEQFLHEFTRRGGRVERSDIIYRHTLADC